jgi:hypothetical protein
LTDPTTTTSAPGVFPGRPRALPEGPGPSHPGSRSGYGQPHIRPCPLLDSEPRRTQGLEVKALAYQSDPQSTRLVLRPVPPREHPKGANHPDHPPPLSLTNTSPYQPVKTTAINTKIRRHRIGSAAPKRNSRQLVQAKVV